MLMVNLTRLMGQSRESSTNTSSRKGMSYNEQALFNYRRQEPGEPVDSFITALHTLAEHCDYKDLREKMIRDRIVVGISNSSLSEKLQLNSMLTLATAIVQVRQAEAVKLQQPALRGTTKDIPVGAVQSKQHSRFKQTRQASQAQPTTQAREQQMFMVWKTLDKDVPLEKQHVASARRQDTTKPSANQLRTFPVLKKKKKPS